MPTLFSRIITEQLPASMVYRDALCVAFMDIHPMAPGHVLVCPILPVTTLDELPQDLRSHLWEIARRVGEAQRLGLGSLAQHFLVNDGPDASQSVPHVHLHVIPRYRGDRLATIARMIAHIGVIALPLPINRKKRRKLDIQAGRIREAMAALAPSSTD